MARMPAEKVGGPFAGNIRLIDGEPFGERAELLERLRVGEIVGLGVG